ncbi:MAG: glycosyltransferase family 4 protein [Planctomycetaceae bacterium]|nr:glycosyltransferase family 4 protein [Planctomycetaceae bacterium]
MEKTQSSVRSNSSLLSSETNPVEANELSGDRKATESSQQTLRFDAPCASPSRYRVAMIRQKFRFDGGGERIVSRMKSILEKQGHEVSLITRKWQESSDSVICCDPPKYTRVLRESLFAKQALQAAAYHKFDLVQSHERIPGCSVFRAGDGVHASWLEQRSRTLNWFSRQSIAISSYHRYVLQAEKELFEHPRLRAVICNSRMVQQEISDRFSIDPTKLKLIYNGVDTDLFHPDLKKHRSVIRQQLNIPESAPLFLFVGSGFERKGVHRLLRAIQKVPDAYAVVVGRDKSMKRTNRLARDLGIADRVRLVGAQNEVGPYYGAADAFVLPTLYDPFPNSVMEAMASGLAVITSTKCGGAELIQNGENGFVCDALDLAGLVEAMQQLSSKQSAEQMGLNARNTIEPYTLKAMNDQLIALYHELLSKPQHV